jgi:hypothetical protein
LSVKWITQVWEGSPYRGERLLLHLALADYANDEGTCFPSQRTLARKARCTEGFVRQAIKQMIADDLLMVERSPHGRGNTALYRLKPVTVKPVSVKPVSPETETRFPDEIAPITRTVMEPSNTVEGFDAFWSAYPRRVAKLEAQRAFARVMSGRDAPALDTLLEAVTRYAQARPDLKYVAHPATWLRQGRWADEIETPATPAARRIDTQLNDCVTLAINFARLRKPRTELEEYLQSKPQHARDAALEAYDNHRSST